jgi:hypothetical protein
MEPNNFGGILEMKSGGYLSFFFKDKLHPVPTIRALSSFYFDALLPF